MRFNRHMLASVTVIIALTIVFATSAKEPANVDGQTDSSDQARHAEDHEHHRAIGEVMVANVLLQLHWQGLETNESFKPVVQELCDSFTPDAFTWGSIRTTVNKPKADQLPSNDFERGLLKRWESAKRPTDHSIRTTREGIFYYRPIYLNEMICVICHRGLNDNEELKEGDLQGIIRIRLATNSKRQKVPVSETSKDR